jgi:hypothetical protein
MAENLLARNLGIGQQNLRRVDVRSVARGVTVDAAVIQAIVGIMNARTNTTGNSAEQKGSGLSLTPFAPSRGVEQKWRFRPG